MGNIMSEYQNQTKNEKILSLHIRVLTELLHRKSFDWIKQQYKESFNTLNYVDIARQSRILSFDKQETLIGAYPISPVKTKYQVHVAGIGSGYAMCAVDALGVAYTFQAKTTIETYDPVTLEPIHINIDPTLEIQEQQNVVVSFDPESCSPTNRVNAVSALDICPTIDFYNSMTSIPANKHLKHISFKEALNSAKIQFSQEAFKACIEQGVPKYEILDDDLEVSLI